MIKRMTAIVLFILSLAASFTAEAIKDASQSEIGEAKFNRSFWESDTIEATGYGLAPKNATSETEAKYKAEQAASLDAYRKLAEYAAGVRITFDSKVTKKEVSAIIVALKHRVIYGVDIHANEIQAYQRNFFPREANNTAQFILLLVVLFFMELFFQRGKLQNVIICALIVLFGWIGFCYFCYTYLEIVLHVLYIPLFIGLLFIGSVTRNYFRARDIKIIFGRYFDPVIMEEIIKNDSDALRLGGRKKEIAVLFADIRSFTVMSEKFKKNTDAVVDILNRYLDMTTKCVRQYHGTLDKFVGDQIMAFWNAPVEQEKAVFLACHAALDMVSELYDLQKEIKKKYDWELTFGIGIHWGEAVVGNIGSSYRMDYTAIGDTVNTAARLEANAGGGEIYISREVADILGNLAKTEPLSTPIKLKGKGDTVEVLKLVDLEGKTIGVKEEL